ncbi:hypothetical protein [Chamaesiphon sp.]|uniref:hypothetical protein n=1 Tax=Chamaesiphon sp. TaxID=2814140 RepID=UPI0035941049
MNFKSILVLGLSVATLGLALPAHADTATVIDSQQGVVVTGDGNNTRQTNTTNVKNTSSGRRTPSATGTSVTNGQSADILGNDNNTRQNNKTNVTNTQRNSR